MTDIGKSLVRRHHKQICSTSGNMFGCNWNFGLWSVVACSCCEEGKECRNNWTGMPKASLAQRHPHTHIIQDILLIVWNLTSLILLQTSCDASFDRKWSKPLFGIVSCVAIILGKNAHVVRRPALSMRAWEMRVTPRQQLAWMLSVVQQSSLAKIFNAALGHSRTTWLIRGFLVAAPFRALEPLISFDVVVAVLRNQQQCISSLTWSHRVIPGDLFISIGLGMSKARRRRPTTSWRDPRRDLGASSRLIRLHTDICRRIITVSILSDWDSLYVLYWFVLYQFVQEDLATSS